MKNLCIKHIWRLLLVIIFGWLGVESFLAYLANHQYYGSMLANGQNWGLLISVIISSCIPLRYLLKARKIKVVSLIISLFSSVALFGLLHSWIKAETLGFWWLIMLFNFAILFGLGLYILIWSLALGSRIQRKWITFKEIRWQELLLSFWIGLVSFLVIIQIFLWIGIFYSIVARIFFIGLGVLIRYERDHLKNYGEIAMKPFRSLQEQCKENNLWAYVILILLGISIAYYLFGFQNSFIPYSTAWDANHEYLYIPKILAENAGVYRGNSVGGGIPGFWHLFITFFFSLTGATNWWFGLAPDTIAVSMNFLSAVLVLVFGVALLFQISEFFGKKRGENALTEIEDKAETKEKNILVQKGEKHPNLFGISMGRGTLLLWMTSGMGAFLVMVDNKTDLGVMALSLLALLAGAIFLGKIKEEHEEKKEKMKYIIIAGLFFGFACLAKPTAFVDIALFGIFLLGLWFSPLCSLWAGISLMGILRLMNILTSSFMITEIQAWRLIGIGIVILLLGIILGIRKKKQKLWTTLSYLLSLGVSFLIVLLLFKAPWIITSQIINDSFSPSQVIKTLFAKSTLEGNKALLATSGELEALELQSQLNQEVFEEKGFLNNNTQVEFWRCSSIYDEEELYANLQEVKWGGLVEDLWRYIGYGWKEFSSEDNRMYSIMKLFFPVSETCYGFNHDAKILCNNAEAIDSFDISLLKEIYANELKDQNSEAGILVRAAIEDFDAREGVNASSYTASDFRDHSVALRQYYQSHAIKSDATSISIPYRSIVPLNIVFNRSLQNHSSYYTDIGFAWILIFILLLISLPVALLLREKDFIALSITTLAGWIIWWIIGSAILWYGTVLISWTAITLLVFFLRVGERLGKNPNQLWIIILVALIGLAGMAQIFLNFMRIGSQGASGPFVWYKGNVGTQNYINENLQTKAKTQYGYGAKEIFDLQFPQYNPIINALKGREDKDWVIVAGTYIQYFLDNQQNLRIDGMLDSFRINISDYDLCKSYQRLKAENTKYLIIDPNIGTVGMGEGNETLFHRFFAKLSVDNQRIEEDGTLTMLIRMYTYGYLDLISTNNIGALYAFSLDDTTLRTYFGEISDEELILKRAKLVGLRYFSGEADSIFSLIGSIFSQRVMNGEAIQDIASILGTEIDEYRVNSAIASILQEKTQWIEELTQGERVVLIQYLNIYQSFASNNNTAAQQIIQNLLLNSVSGSSQVIALELK